MNMKSYSYGWIEAAIRYTGRFGPREKMAYQDVFQLSAPTASRHQEYVADALEEFTGCPLFNTNSRGHLQGGKLSLLPNVELPEKTIFERVPSVERWLQDTFDGVCFYSEKIIRAEPKPEIIRPIVNALSDKKILKIQYHSKQGISMRTLSPQVVVKVAGRMHLRAFDHGKNGYRDFVLTRISTAELVKDDEQVFVGFEHDRNWQTYVEVEIKEKTQFSESETQAIRMEFDLTTNGVKTMTVRKPLAQYIADIEDENFAPPVKVTVLPNP